MTTCDVKLLAPKLQLLWDVIKSGPKKKKRGHGRPRLIELARSEWPVWSNPTVKLKLLKKSVLILIESQKLAHEFQIWTTEQWKKVDWFDESCFLLHHVDDQVCVCRTTGNTLTPKDPNYPLRSLVHM